jgi:hypothetical protein
MIPRHPGCGCVGYVGYPFPVFAKYLLNGQYFLARSVASDGGG